MPTAIHTPSERLSHPSPSARGDDSIQTTPQSVDRYQIIRRNGAVVPFEPTKIAVAMMKAFLAVTGAQGAAWSAL